jgi:hypothetical protein
MDLLKPPQVLRDALPQAGKDFLDIGWWLVLLLIAAVVLGVIALVVRALLRSMARKEKDPQDALRENLAEYPAAPARSGSRTLFVESIPARIRLVVVAPQTRSQTVTAQQAEALLELVVKGLGNVAMADRPRVRVWPHQLSIEGFGNTFHRLVTRPEREHQPSRWVLCAGQARAGKQMILLGLALQTDEETTLGRRTLDAEDWTQLLAVRAK